MVRGGSCLLVRSRGTFNQLGWPVAAVLALLHHRLVVARQPLVRVLSAAHGKESVTIAEALSHRAGLRASSLCPLRGLWRALCGDYRALMPSGIQWIASCKPTWSGTEYARYHPVSWSWVAGGIYEHVAQRREPGAMAPHIGEGAAALAKVLKVAESEIQLGEWRRGDAPIAPLVRPRPLVF